MGRGEWGEGEGGRGRERGGGKEEEVLGVVREKEEGDVGVEGVDRDENAEGNES